MTPTNRVTFLVDGFNLYHSVREASDALGHNGKRTRWLNIDSLCRSYLPVVRRNVNSAHTELAEVYYFSAYASHRERVKPNTVARHKSFVQCLESTKINVSLGMFKTKRHTCANCGHIAIGHEEKETDVAIAVKLLELLLIDSCDTIVLVTGDTDLAPPVRTAKKLFPQKNILFAFPYNRMNNDLKQLAPESFNIRKDAYVTHQFSDNVTLADGTVITKPPKW